MATEQSSIQRFLQNRASSILIGSYSRQGFAWQIGIGAVFIAVGVVLGFLGGALRVPGLMWGGSLGPIIAGGINVLVGMRMKRKYALSPNEPKLSSEAKAFLQNLMSQTNTSWTPNSWQSKQTYAQQTQGANPIQNGETVLHQLGKHWGILPKTPKDVLPRPVYDMLETACYHYNRVLGILEAGRDDATLAKVGQTAKAGADEAIFGVLHHSATMHRFPETVSASSRDCEEKIRALKVLADGLEKIQIRPFNLSERLGYVSAMDSALEEVRLEGLAREELRYITSEDEELRNPH